MLTKAERFAGNIDCGIRERFDTVIKSSRASGMAAEADTPGLLFRKIPFEMKALGFGTRKKFDEIAAGADQ